MYTLSAPRALRRLIAAVHLLAAIVLGASAAPASAAEFTPVIHLNACDRALRCPAQASPNIVQVVQNRRPEVLTLNEICSVTVAEVARKTGYKRMFIQAGSKSTCRKGRGLYGNAILAAPHRTLTPIGIWKYTRQWPGAEQRKLACADSSGALVCTTHLDFHQKSQVQVFQAKQMRRILNTLLPSHPSAFLGADLNMDPPRAQAFAVPAAMARFGDGRVMHILYSKAFTGVRGEVFATGWTDHPGLQLFAPTG
jgi:hypothetical protein